MIDFTYILLLIVVLCWTINPFLKKIVAKKMNAEELMLLNHFIISSFMIIYLIYLVSKGKVSHKCIQKLDREDMVYLILASISTILGSLLLIRLLQKHDTSFIIPNLQPMVIILTIIIGYFIYHESLNIKKVLGIITIVGGLLLLNSSKN